MAYNNYPNAPILPMYGTNGGFGAQQPCQANYNGLAPKQAFQNYGYQSPTQQPNTVKTNMVFVTGLEDAYQREALPNSQMIYLDQDKPFLYCVCTDAFGRKSSETYDLVKNENKHVDTQQNDFVSKDEFIKYQKQTNETIDKLRRIIALEPIPTTATSTATTNNEVSTNG